jgi:RNA polymerase sigma factor (sigma-70 family)
VTDEELMLAVREGDLAKLGVLFERYHVVLFDFLSRMTGNPTAAEDLVQDIFVRILSYRATFRDDGRFETWVFRIARNARADYFRSRPPVEAIADEALEKPETAAGPAHQLEYGRDVMRLKRALSMLRDDKRELVVLARYRNMKQEQIAALLGVDVGTVKVRLHRAVKELRDIFLGLSDEATSSSWNVKKSARSLPTI